MNGARNQPMYYSDKITRQNIETWDKNKDYVYLKGDTGTGKTTFVFNELLDYYLYSTKKIIVVLSNRKLLTKQHRKALKAFNVDVDYYEINGYSIYGRVKIMTYQAFHEIWIKKNDIEIDLDCEVFSGNDFVFILDECHYFLSDFWNKTTERTLNTILKFKTTTFFISATGDNVVKYVNLIFEKKITEENTIIISQDYSNITLKAIKDNTKNHDKIVNLICDILDNTSDKVMYYLNHSLELDAIAKDLKERYKPDDVRLCYSPNNRKKPSLPSEDNQAFTDDKQMNCRCILTTKIIDNGIDIYDDALKHVIIDMAEPETIIQAIGRKRTKTPLTVYINEQSKVRLQKWIEEAEYKANNYKSHLFEYQFKMIIQDLNLFLKEGTLQTIYKRLQHTRIKLDADCKYNALSEYLRHNSGSDNYIDKEYVKTLLSDLGLPAKQINKVNEALKELKLPYQIIEKRKRINGDDNASNVWYVSDV